MSVATNTGKAVRPLSGSGSIVFESVASRQFDNGQFIVEWCQE